MASSSWPWRCERGRRGDRSRLARTATPTVKVFSGASSSHADKDRELHPQTDVSPNVRVAVGMSMAMDESTLPHPRAVEVGLPGQRRPARGSLPALFRSTLIRRLPPVGLGGWSRRGRLTRLPGIENLNQPGTFHFHP